MLTMTVMRSWHMGLGSCRSIVSRTGEEGTCRYTCRSGKTLMEWTQTLNECQVFNVSDPEDAHLICF